jgi:hypothetical protein
VTGTLAQASRRPPISGSAFIRALAALNVDDAPHAAPTDAAFADRLCRWFSWTDAIALSAVLNSPAPQPTEGVKPATEAATRREHERVRSALAQAIPDSAATMALPSRLLKRTATEPAEATIDTTGDFSPHRLRYTTRQQAMEAGIAPLRRKVRAALSAASPAMAQLAAMDAVMEQVLGTQERTLLASVPRRLEQHFKRLHRAHLGAPEGTPPGAWLARFEHDLQALLRAELDFRLQPVEGMLDALRGAPSPTDSTMNDD